MPKLTQVVPPFFKNLILLFGAIGLNKVSSGRYKDALQHSED